MSKRDDRVSLVDMLIHAREAVDLLDEASADELKSNRVMQLALMRLVEIVGEAANRVSPPTQQRYPEIPWPLIIGMRNRIVHEYDNVNLNILWSTITNELPPLINQFKSSEVRIAVYLLRNAWLWK